MNVTDIPATALHVGDHGDAACALNDGEDAGADQRDEERGGDRDAPDQATRGGRRRATARPVPASGRDSEPSTVPESAGPLGASPASALAVGAGALAADPGAIVEVDRGCERPVVHRDLERRLRKPELLLDRLQIADELERAGLAIAADACDMERARIRSRLRGTSTRPVGCGFAFSMRAISAIVALSPPGTSNGVRPASSEYTVAPSDQTSLATVPGISS